LISEDGPLGVLLATLAGSPTRQPRWGAWKAAGRPEDINMARAIWKGSISFGLVTIPVELHTAVRDHRPKFRMLHARDKSPVRYERVCQREGKPVAWEDLVKGYEYEKGHFVVLTKEDLKAVALNRDRSIDILDFVKSEEIDDRFFETPYYLTPDKVGQHAYALLREALKDSGRTGIAKIIIRDTQHLAAVEVINDAIVLTLLRYADELVETGQLPFPSAEKVRKAELDMAKMLIDNLAGEWDPSKYTDEYRENLMKLIKARMKGERPHLPVAEPAPQGEVVDLMERLRRSLESRAPSSRAARSGQAAAAKGRHASHKKTRHAA
jgi:DNA end-binding protein Ku